MLVEALLKALQLGKFGEKARGEGLLIALAIEIRSQESGA